MKIKKQFAVTVIALLILGICFFSFINRTILSSESSFAMDTYMNYQVWSNEDEAKASKELVSDLDKQFSMYENGGISQINKTAGKEIQTTDDIYDIIAQSNALSDQYGSEVDISAGTLTSLWGISTATPYLPTQEEALEAVSHIGYSKIQLGAGKKITVPAGTMLDLGSVAKGFACDKLKELYDKNDVPCAIVSMGSSSLLYGKKPDKSQFTVEIKDPDNGESLGTIKTNQTFLSTSGGYERYFEIGSVKYCHIFNLSTGFPAQSDITSVTVLCDSGIKSDFLSTLIFIDGIDGLKEHLNAEDYKIIAATKDKKVYASAGVDFTLNKDSGYTAGDF